MESYANFVQHVASNHVADYNLLVTECKSANTNNVFPASIPHHFSIAKRHTSYKVESNWLLWDSSHTLLWKTKSFKEIFDLTASAEIRCTSTCTSSRSMSS